MLDSLKDNLPDVEPEPDKAPDRRGADLTKSERRMIVSLAGAPELSELGAASLRLLVDAGTA